MKYRNGLVSWHDIKKAYILTSECPLNLLPKITNQHFKLTHFSKMKVSYVTQVFSNSMYTALLVYKTMFPENFEKESDMTAIFLRDVDKLFDSLNSSLINKSLPHKLNYAISANSEHLNFLKEMYDVLSHCKILNISRIPPCIRGFMLTINGVLQLAEDLRKNYNIEALRTRRFNQDPLENLFSKIREQNGCCVNPSPKQFEFGLRHLMISQMTRVAKASNCEMDDNNLFAKLSNIPLPKKLKITSSASLETFSVFDSDNENFISNFSDTNK